MSDTKCVKNEKNGWIRKESRSRPNQFYYFNTKTGESRWDGETEPSTASEKSKKLSEKIHKHSDDKNVNKTTPTVAQNALQSKEKKISSKSREGLCFYITVILAIPLLERSCASIGVFEYQ